MVIEWLKRPRAAVTDSERCDEDTERERVKERCTRLRDAAENTARAGARSTLKDRATATVSLAHPRGRSHSASALCTRRSCIWRVSVHSGTRGCGRTQCCSVRQQERPRNQVSHLLSRWTKAEGKRTSLHANIRNLRSCSLLDRCGAGSSLRGVALAPRTRTHRQGKSNATVGAVVLP